MSTIDENVWCDGCGVEITWGPLVVNHSPYCCQDCSEGLPCHCGERLEMEDDRRSGGESLPGGIELTTY